jgi:hypothetical protein
MATIEVPTIIVRCRVEWCVANENGFCSIETGQIVMDVNDGCTEYVEDPEKAANFP